MRTVRIGTRGSQLALWQANTVAALLEHAGVPSEIVKIKTAGDRLQEAPLSEVGGKRLFVKEIEDALLREEVDIAVHSAKDMPAVLPEALTIAAVLPREDPRDALVISDGATEAGIEAVRAHLGSAPVIATSSVRRVAQLAGLLPRATFVPIRGNVDTRLRKLDAGGFDALVLASAGMVRLGFAGRISARIPVTLCIPAPGQGIVAIETRAADDAMRSLLQRLTDPAAETALTAERTVVAALGGGCQLPLGAVATVEHTRLTARGIVTSLDGTRVVRGEAIGSPLEAEAVGRALAAALLDGGAAGILDEVRRAQGPVGGSY